MEKDEQIVLFFTVDRNYLVPAAAAIESILELHADWKLKFYLVIGDENHDWVSPLVNLIEFRGQEVSLKKVNLSEFLSLKTNLHFSPANYFRLLAADLFEESKIIYLDSDIILRAPLHTLWKIDLGDYPLAAVEDALVNDFHRLQLSSDEGYFNSGVMLLNLDKWRSMSLGEKVLNYILTFPDRILYADQCGLNANLKGNWMRLHPKWNVQTELLIPSGSTKKHLNKNQFQVEEAKANPFLIHFTGVSKPWNLGSTHPYKRLFWKTLAKTPLNRKLPLNFSVPNLLKTLFPLSVKKFYWRHFGKPKALKPQVL